MVLYGESFKVATLKEVPIKELTLKGAVFKGVVLREAKHVKAHLHKYPNDENDQRQDAKTDRLRCVNVIQTLKLGHCFVSHIIK